MKHSNKLIFNAISLFVKIIITCIVQLIGTRIALSALGEEGFGLYNLLAGIIVLFSFVTGALLISTQRYLSVAIGERNKDKLKLIFNVSLLIHILISFIIVLFLLCIKGLCFNNLLNIAPSLMESAKRMYDILILSIFITVTTIPYAACINAREDMVYYSFTEIVSLCVKLWAALSLLLFEGDLLLIYTMFMTLAIAIGSLLKIIWCRKKYNECRVSLTLMYNKPLLKEMAGFVSWNTLGTAAVAARNQGVAFLFNIFYGTVINAAYGVANQVNSLVLSFATTLTTIFTPSIIQQKGAGNIDKMLNIAIFSSKLSFYMSSILAIPILVYLQDILSLWLVNVPVYTDKFVIRVVFTFLIQQLYPGINRTIYAVGDIKLYQILISITLLSVIPIGYMLLKMGVNPTSVLTVVFILQVICLCITVALARKLCKLNAKDFYISSVLKPVAIFLVVAYLSKYISTMLILSLEMKLLSMVVICIIYTILYYIVVLSQNERLQLSSIFLRFIHK